LDFRGGESSGAADTVFVPKRGTKVKCCPYHKAIFLDSTENHRVNGQCYPVNKMHIVSRFVLPPSQEYYYRRVHPEYTTLPPYLPGCQPPRENVMDIVEPDNNSAIYIPKGIEESDGMLIFEAVHRNSDATIFWHIDNEYITSTKGTHKIEVSPSVGKHILTVEDEQGNIVRRRFKILAK